MEKTIAIWGTGKVARRLYYRLRGDFDVKYWYSDDCEMEELYGLPIRHYQGIKKDELIIIADGQWGEICNRLSSDGGVFIDEYIPYWLYNDKMIHWIDLEKLNMTQLNLCLYYIKRTRKIAIVHGNCQTDLIQKFLAESDSFVQQYLLINIPRVFQADTDTWELLHESQLFELCDLFIYQNISDRNKYGVLRASEKIKSKLATSCITVSIPNIYFDGYFPQLIKNESNILMEVQEDGLFKWSDKYFDERIKNGKTFESALAEIGEDNFIDEKTLNAHIMESFLQLQKREESTDVKISDYIKKYYNKQQLFFSPNHPVNELVIECAKRIIQKVGLVDDMHPDSVSQIYSLVGEDVPIYPAVVKLIGLTNYFESFFPNRYIENCSLSFKEYYRLYYRTIGSELNKTY